MTPRNPQTKKFAEKLGELRRTAELRSSPPTVPGLMQLVPKLNRGFVEPLHLAPVVDLLERARKYPVRAIISCPPQHGKSVTCTTALIWHMLQDSRSHIYATYNRERRDRVSRDTRSLAGSAGLAVDGNLSDWRVPTGSTIRFTSIDSTLTGDPCTGIALIDDPYKGWADARSPVVRRQVDDWYKGTLSTRLHESSSVIIVATRWDPDDLSGTRIREGGWIVVNLPAILDSEGEETALAPRLHSLKFLQEQRRVLGPMMFEALYQGNPRTVEGKLFTGVNYYSGFPLHLKVAIGVDLAYTESTQACFSVAVVLGESGARWYVIDVVRGQWKIETFAMELKALAQRFPGAPMRFYGNTTEKGSAHLLAMLGVPIHHRLTITDKYARALPVSVAWNRGDVLIPAVTRNNAGWLSDFTRVVTNFTGAKGEENDDVDAMSAAFDQLPERRPATILKPGSKEWLLAEETAMREERKREVEESIERRYEEEHPWE